MLRCTTIIAKYIYKITLVTRVTNYRLHSIVAMSAIPCNTPPLLLLNAERWPGTVLKITIGIIEG